MKLIVLVLVALVATVAAVGRGDEISFDSLKNSEVLRSWMIWKAKHNKVYQTGTEESIRFKNFQASVARIAAKNAESPNARFALNKFSDLSPLEFKRLLGYVRNETAPRKADVFPKILSAVPSTYDWRKNDRVTPVKDQGQCGSCWAFSVTENIESIYMIANSIGSASMPALAPQEIVDCDTSDDGCNGGDPPTAYQYVISAGGLETNSDYPYTAEDGTCAFDSTKVKAKITNWKYATQTNDETEMQNAMISVGPLSICVDASSWQDYSSGVFMASQCTTDLDHCVQAVGWDTTASTPYWIVRNSWGTDWGLNGYIYLQYGQDTCGLATEATSSCISC